MRPIKLTISAFGSYAGENIIEFDKLGTDGLYLITGVTGAGKSTIFEAISFALYGKASDKKTEMLRSEYASADADTFVELEFEFVDGDKRKLYKLRRNPEYLRQNKRGEGLVKQPAGAALTCPDGKVVSGIDRVNAEIEKLLGMTLDQFRQTVMIEQGKFRELLTADTKTRKEILRSIFNIYVYNDFQERIGARAKAANDELEKRLDELANVCSIIKCDDSEELSALRGRAASGELLILSELEERLAKQNSEDKVLLENLNKKQETISDEINRLTKLIEKGETQEKLRKELDAALEKLPEIQENAKEKSEAARLCEEEKTAENDKLKNEIGGLENELPKYRALEEKRESLAELERRIAENSAVKTKNEARLKALQEELASLQKESASLENAGENIAKTEADIKDAERRAKALSELKAELGELEASRVELRDLQEKYLKARDAFNTLDKSAKEKRERLNDEQAGILAETLRENEPCPVCGSLHHPKPAKKTAGAPSKDEVEEVEANAEEARGRCDDLSSKCNAKKSVIEEKERGISIKISELLPGASLENAAENADGELEKLKEKSDSLREKLTAEIKNQNRKKELSELLPQKQDEIEKWNGAVAALNDAVVGDAGRKKQLLEQIEGEERLLKFQSEADVEAHIETLRETINRNNAAIKLTGDVAEEWSQRLQKIKNEIETHEKLLSTGEAIDVEEKTREMEKLQSDEKQAKDKFIGVKIRRDTNETAAKKLSEISARVTEAEREKTLVQSLADTARGKLAGTKIDLESFVQARYLDSILRCANQHLHKMSNGQYDLIRVDRKNIGTAQGQHSLDLNVKDYYNGTPRDVKSLSGGESFLASLSLALGLSDTVQQRGGGVRLETMFIDEGFGSLSPEFLDRAMSVLRSLTETNRLIGIISHVEEIKRLIPKRIEITKDGANGSRAKVVV